MQMIKFKNITDEFSGGKRQVIGTKIMAGELRGIQIGPLPKHIFARPILARIKKSLFDILKTRLEDSKFLDLFSGSGTVGFEAVSRGAGKVTMIDANPKSVRWLQQTLFDLQRKNRWVAERNVEIHCANVMNGLSWLNDQYDLIFSGAPYVDENKKALYFIDNLLVNIEREKLLAPGGLFIAQHHEKEPFTPPASWNFFRQEEYGDSRLSFFKHAT